MINCFPLMCTSFSFLLFMHSTYTFAVSVDACWLWRQTHKPRKLKRGQTVKNDIHTLFPFKSMQTHTFNWKYIFLLNFVQINQNVVHYKKKGKERRVFTWPMFVVNRCAHLLIYCWLLVSHNAERECVCLGATFIQPLHPARKYFIQCAEYRTQSVQS